MHETILDKIPQEYELMKRSVSNEIINRLYSKFSFYYIQSTKGNINSDEKQRKTEVENCVVKYIQNFKFFTYYINNFHSISSNHNSNSHINSIYNLIICTEGQCLLVEQIDLSTIEKIFQTLKSNKNIKMIDAKSNYKIMERTKEDEESDLEVSNFCSNFLKEMKTNKFINLTIKPIVCYLIRRYFCPTDYFKDQSFFNFNAIEAKEQEIRNDISNYMFTNFNGTEKEINTEILKKKITAKINDNEEVFYKDFKENDFIVLRNISSNQKSSYDLVIYVQNFYLFFMKKMNDTVDEEDDNEVNYCKNYRNRCMTPFYGFLRNSNQKIYGFIYEFMSNGQLDVYLTKHQKTVSNVFLLMTMNRIFQGIEYLHSKSLIHRDIKPSNIFLNHDFLAFFCDFETIRQPNYDVKEMTVNIGSHFYSSPEQTKGKPLSYSTDIYSFGLLIYYLFEQKHFESQPYQKIKKNILANALSGIRYIFNLCIKYEPSERPKCCEIKSIFIEQINPFEYLFNYLMDDKEQIKTIEIIQYIAEYFFILRENEERMNKFFDILTSFQHVFNIKFKQDESAFLFALGTLYRNGYGVKQDYKEAIKYYEMSAQKNNSESLLFLGTLFLIGEGVNQDILKAREYFELSAKMNNSDALWVLGDFYQYGINVEQNYQTAKKYYELSARLNNASALYNLGMLYLYGNGVTKNLETAMEYFKLSSKYNNSYSQWVLGDFYQYGINVEQNYKNDYIKKDYEMAKVYYEIAANKDQANALYDLGCLYYKGYGVEKDESKAMYYFEQAAKNGSTSALILLGRQYEKEKNYSKAKEYYEIAANLYDSEAYFCLGFLYFKGIGVDMNYKKAKEYFFLSADQCNSDGLLYLGHFYENGFGVEKNLSEALKYYQLSANENNPSALFNLGHFNYEGIVVKQNYKIAKEYFEKAAELNDSDSLIYLGMIYENGYGVKKDYSKAKEYYESAAKLQNTEAFLHLAKMYEEGLGVEKNYKKSLAYLNIYNPSDEPSCYEELGNLYYYGENVEQDYSKALKYYELAAKSGNADALFSLGFMYNDGIGVKKDFFKAKQYYELAAKQGNSAALNNLGVLYENGNGVEKDYLKAKEYYEMAAKQNNSDALNNLGLLYENGYGVTIDYPLAKHYYLLSSKLDNSEAFLNLGNLYKNGHGVKKDYSQAKKYYELSAERGDSEASYNLGVLYENGHGVKQSYIKAKKYYLESAKQKNASAYFNLGKLYFHGLGVDKDYIKAKEYYELAVLNNNYEACFYLGYLYSVGDIFIVNISKAIQYYIKCIEFNRGIAEVHHSFNDPPSYEYKLNIYFYPSYNDLGLIYLIDYNDIEKANKYIAEAGLNEYPFGQNNYGLMLQFFQNRVVDAKHFYEKASKCNFTIAEYNLAYLFELNGQTDEAIEYYIKASEDEYQPLVFNDIEIEDKRLEISKIFIICLVNLKLIEFYFKNEDYDESNEYFIKLISDLEINTDDLEYYFRFCFNDDESSNAFDYLESIIFKCPYFNMSNQPNLIQEIKHILAKKIKTDGNKLLEIDIKTNLDEIKYENEEKDAKKDEIIDFDPKDESVYDDPNQLFDYILSDDKLKNIFIEEISKIINIMKNQLYTPPFNILFGRINLATINKNENVNHAKQNLNKSFYDGFYS